MFLLWSTWFIFVPFHLFSNERAVSKMHWFAGKFLQQYYSKHACTLSLFGLESIIFVDNSRSLSEWLMVPRLLGFLPWTFCPHTRNRHRIRVTTQCQPWLNQYRATKTFLACRRWSTVDLPVLHLANLTMSPGKIDHNKMLETTKNKINITNIFQTLICWW